MTFHQLGEAIAELQQAAVNHCFKHQEQDPAYARYSGPEGYYADLVSSVFAPWLDMPDPAAYAPLISDLAAAMSKLATSESNTDPRDINVAYLANPDLSVIKSASDNMQNWTGSAAVAFKQRFLDKLPSLLHNHFTLIAAAKAALEGHRDMWAKARTDILGIVDTTIKALDNDPCCYGETNWSFNFTAIAVGFGILSVVLDVVSDGVAIPATLAILGNASYIPAAASPGANGTTAMKMMTSMQEAIKTLQSNLTDIEHTITSALNSDISTVDSARSRFVLNRPALADATSANVTSHAYLGDYQS